MLSVVILLGAAAFSYLLNVLMLRFSSNFGVQSRQAQGVVRWGSTSKPTTGGISFYITFLLAAIVLLMLRPEGLNAANRLLPFFLSASLAFLVGLADDAYGTHPFLKLAGQACCGLILLAFGIRIHFFEIYALDALLTLFWVVGMMNSLNMLDNMDAVTATVSLSILVITLAMMVLGDGVNHLFLLLAAIAGGFAGFLFMNWRPAKIYMGDTGSMFIGLSLAFFGILYFWNIETSPDNISYLRRGLIPLLAFLVPIMDTSFVTISRISRGISPLQGGKDHLTHHLAHLGVPEALIPVVLGMVSVLCGGIAIFARMLTPEWVPVYTLLFWLFPLSVALSFFFLYKKGERIGKAKALMAERAKRHSDA